MSQTPDEHDIRSAVLASYRERARRAGGNSSCCGPAGAATPSCCGPAEAPAIDQLATELGYSKAEQDAVPEGANLGLGCGNPLAIASLRPGESVLDLGSGGGFDCFLAAEAVGPQGEVIGVDMTPEMIALARANASKGSFTNVSFRLGEIEHLPVADSSVDIIMSNCVINLAPDKNAVYREAFRVLKPGGRLAIADIVATSPITDQLRADLKLWASCASGACQVSELVSMLSDIGFTSVDIDLVEGSRELIRQWSPVDGLEELIVSARITAVKP
jgi:arsenite methyltransferase